MRVNQGEYNAHRVQFLDFDAKRMEVEELILLAGGCNPQGEVIDDLTLTCKMTKVFRV